jgi:hypothetical protein
MGKEKISKKNNKEEKHMITLKRHCSPDVSLEKSLEQMKLIRKNKLPKTTWKQFKKELKNDDQED